MADNFEISVTIPNFGPMTEKKRAALRQASVSLTRALAAKVRENLSGKVLTARSGRLRSSVKSQLIETAYTVGGRVFTSGVPYARIHEYGGITRPHVIAAKNSRSLAFVWGNRGQVFFKSVNHPGSRIPQRSYMNSALESMRDEIVEAYRSAAYT
jgi:phage gpG-like protein